MPSREIRASAVIQAPAAGVYRLIADYRDGHRRIVPPKYFRWLRVDRGGYGAGTGITFGMRVLGTSRTLRAAVTEPEPGRVLVETDPDAGIVTTFIVEPVGEGRSKATISTVLTGPAGLAGAIERFVSSRVLPPIYREELKRLAEIAEGRRTHEPVSNAEC
jgi:hypothetical protein